MPLAPGQILNNRYRIVKLLGQGGFGAVYRTWDLTLNCPCALKESFEVSPEGQRQFLREAQILARLSHPNLPRVTDFFAEAGGGQYLVMDFVEGQDLEERLVQAGGRLPEAQALGYITQVCDALDYLHRQNPAVIHRDIKPANIKITPAGQAMLVDFGVAKVYDPGLKTTVGARAVTPGYSPIEQYGKGNTDARSDIYSLAATLYALLTGQEPPEAPQRAVRDPLVPPRQIAPGLSPVVEAAILKAMHNDPQQRFQSAGEFWKGLSGQSPVASSQPSLIPRPPVPLPAAQGGTGVPVVKQKPHLSRWKGLGLLVGLTGLAVLAVGGNVIRQAREDALMSADQTAQARTTQIAQAFVTQIVQARVTWTAQAHTAAQTEEAQATQTAQAVVPGIWDDITQVSPLDGMVLVYIPEGTFQMGSESGDSDEQPVHTVTLDAFWMDQTEVTNGMYALCVAAGACSAPRRTGSYSQYSYYGNAAYADYPVIWVDWYQAEAYCAWAGRDLPTEAQWEYAARGGLAGARYPWGEGIDSTRANYGGDVGDTSEVGSYLPNGYGLYDMAGNVWEWVWDWYAPYSSAALENPTGHTSGTFRALRGGAWYDDANFLRSAHRFRHFPNYPNYFIGFRCALSP